MSQARPQATSNDASGQVQEKSAPRPSQQNSPAQPGSCNGSHIYLGDRQIPVVNVVVAEQTHSDLVHICTPEDSGAGFGDHPQIPVADGLVSNIPGQYLLIRTADCTPVLFIDQQGRAVGAVHSGREGTRKNIAGKAVKLLQEHYGVAPQDIIAYIGAGICQEHYQVSEAIWQGFQQSLQPSGLKPDQNNPRQINIRLCIFQQLIAAGIPFKNIEQDHTCTYESLDHFSFRRDGTHNRQINLIGIEYE